MFLYESVTFYKGPLKNPYGALFSCFEHSKDFLIHQKSDKFNYIYFNFQNEDYITIEIGEDINSEDKNKLFSDNTLKCEPLKTTDSISNSSTSETLIDIQLSPSHYSEDNSENVFETEESECSKDLTDDKNSNICLTSLNSRRHTDSAIQPAIPSIKDENLDNSANNNNSKTTFASIATSRTNADELITTVVEKEQEIDSFEGVKSSSSGKKLIRAETVACCRDASPTR